MATSRSFGGRLLTTRSPMRISPEVMFSSPATIRSRVDFPQPEGPTRTTNSPSPIATSTPRMMVTEENFRRAIYLSRGDPLVFVERPISAVLLLMSLVLPVILLLPAVKQKREEVF